MSDAAFVVNDNGVSFTYASDASVNFVKDQSADDFITAMMEGDEDVAEQMVQASVPVSVLLDLACKAVRVYTTDAGTDAEALNELLDAVETMDPAQRKTLALAEQPF